MLANSTTTDLVLDVDQVEADERVLTLRVPQSKIHLIQPQPQSLRLHQQNGCLPSIRT